MSARDHVLQPLWWAPVLARYRRLSFATRATLDVVVARLWSRYRDVSIPDDCVWVAPKIVAATTGWSLRHTQRAILALSTEAGGIACLSTVTRGHGIFDDLTDAPPPLGAGRSWRPARRLLRLRPWRSWWWRPGQVEIVEAVVLQVEAEGEVLDRGQRFARILVRHLAWSSTAGSGEPADVPGDPHFERWARQLGKLHADEADLRLVLRYVRSGEDPFWSGHISGPTAAWRLLIAWEGLFLRARAQERAA